MKGFSELNSQLIETMKWAFFYVVAGDSARELEVSCANPGGLFVDIEKSHPFENQFCQAGVTGDRELLRRHVK